MNTGDWLIRLLSQPTERGATRVFITFFLEKFGGTQGGLFLPDMEKKYLTELLLVGKEAEVDQYSLPAISLEDLSHPASYCMCLGQRIRIDSHKLVLPFETGLDESPESVWTLLFPVNSPVYAGVGMVRYSLGDSKDCQSNWDKECDTWLEYFIAVQRLWCKVLQAEKVLNAQREEQRQTAQKSRKLKQRKSKSIENNILGQSVPMQQLREQILRLAGSGFNVLIRGETGTGKDLVAKELYRLSSYVSGKLVSINCSAVPESLLESELFGYVKGAFTGATSDREGLLAAAEGGMLFLDEIGDMPAGLQAKLLRVLQERCYRPLGATLERAAQFRLVAATHQPLEDLIAQGRFREDLYYRLQQSVITVPPLRERTGDIPLLSQYFMKQVCLAEGWAVPVLTDEVLNWLSSLDFPGNVRELEHLIQQACLIAHQRGEVYLEDLQLLPCIAERPHSALVREIDMGLKEACENFEMHYIEQALLDAGGKKCQAARRLSVSERTLYNKCLKYGIGL